MYALAHGCTRRQSCALILDTIGNAHKRSRTQSDAGTATRRLWRSPKEGLFASVSAVIDSSEGECECAGWALKIQALEQQQKNERTR